MSYWEVHGLLFLVGLAVFPRITLLFSNAIGFGFLFWLGWLFVPHLTVAVLATTFYFDTNPFLVLFSWLIALGGESKEKGERIFLEGSNEIYDPKDIANLAKDLENELKATPIISMELHDTTQEQLKEWGFPEAKLLPIPT